MSLTKVYFEHVETLDEDTLTHFLRTRKLELVEPRVGWGSPVDRATK